MTANQEKTTALTLDENKTALIVVDMQNAFLRDDGSISRAGMDVTHLKKATASVQRLVDTCHDAGLPVIFSRYVLRSDFKDAGCLMDFFPSLKDANSMVSGTWDSELDERMNVKPGDYIVEKSRYSAFYNTNLEVILRGLDVDTLIVCGVTTEICVESTIRDAFFRDYRLVVPQDAVAAMDLQRHECTLRTIQYGFGIVTKVGEIVKAIEASQISRR